MPVVSNTSPLNYLVLIGEIEILPTLHHHVVIPVAVSEELHDPATLDAVRGWIENPPGWIEIRRPKHLPDERLGELGRGERDAILLAEERLLNGSLDQFLRQRVSACRQDFRVSSSD
jgi:predicted nucleic acid-binding protein